MVTMSSKRWALLSIAGILFSGGVALAEDGIPRRILGFSKDVCESSIGNGDASITFCEDGATTLCVRNATWRMNLQPNKQGCFDCDGLEGRCDETAGRKDGDLEARTNFSLRIDGPCRFRGCWNARWRFATVDGTFYDGTAMGTFGSGTHREFVCNEFGRGACERCYDVSFIPLTPDFGFWRVGVEGCFDGDISISPSDPPSEEICFTISGDLFATGTCDAGPFDPNSFRFLGTADGSFLQICQ